MGHPELIESVELFPLRIPRDVPYLGPLEEGNRPNAKGYIIRPGNRTVYSIHDQTLLVKVTTAGGAVGWGECFGVVAPQVAQAILQEIFIPFVIGRNPHDVERIYEDLYDSQRVRGYFGGYALDAIAGLVDAGRIRPVVDTVYSGLENMAEAHQRCESRHASGKLVVRVS